jgi:hypothetical protein
MQCFNVTILLLIHHKFVNAGPFLMLKEGAVNGLEGYSGLAYQAIRYEPLCGNLGTDSRYNNPINMADYCRPAIDSLANNTKDSLALYDTTGSRLKNARVGAGTRLCLFFALAQTGDGIKGALCIFVDEYGRGDGWWSLHLDGIAAGNYRPNVDKALPFCKDVEFSELRKEWSSTAF